MLIFLCTILLLFAPKGGQRGRTDGAAGKREAGGRASTALDGGVTQPVSPVPAEPVEGTPSVGPSRVMTPDGWPVDRFLLHTYQEVGGELYRVGRTEMRNTGGEFDLDLEPGRYVHWIFAPEGVWTGTSEVHAGESPRFDATLRADAWIAGRVLDGETASPLAQTLVTLTDFPGAVFSRSGSDGAFRLPVPPGLRAMTLSHEGYVPLHRSAIPVGEGAVAELGDLALERGVRVAGRVLRRGDPEAGVRVTLQDEATGWRRVASSREDGAFEFPGVEPGTYALQAGGIVRGLRVEAGSSPTVEIDLDPRRVIEGRVIGEEGGPVAALLQLYVLSGEEVRAATTDSAGAFRIPFEGDLEGSWLALFAESAGCPAARSLCARRIS